MPEKELREKYGGKLDKALNRAVRAETPEGNAALDLLAKLSGPAASSGWTDDSGQPTPQAAAYIKHREKVERLLAEVRRKWGIPQAKSAAAKAKVKAKASTKKAPRGTK